jgi:hypothetical protein
VARPCLPWAGEERVDVEELRVELWGGLHGVHAAVSGRESTTNRRRPQPGVGVAYSVDLLCRNDGVVLEIMSKMHELLEDLSSSSRDETPQTNAR